MHKRFNSIVKTTNSKIEHQRDNYRHSIGDIESSLLTENHRQKNKSALSNKYKLLEHH